MIGKCIFGLAVGIYLYAFALSKTVKASLLSINQSARAKTTNPSIFLEQVIEFLQLHTCAKQLSDKISTIITICWFGYFICLLFPG